MLSFNQLFGSNFWSSIRCQPSESIEKLLTKDDCKLEELLDDSDLLQECKSSNKNLIKYLDREKIKQLIDLITVMPEEDEHNRGHKYPFTANEVFNWDIQEVIDKFFIAPCDDVQEEPEPEHPTEDEDSTKFESGFEKDNDDSGSDSEEDDEGREHDDHEKEEQTDEKKVEKDLNVVDLEVEADKADKPETESIETEENKEEAPQEKKDEPVELDVEDKTVEKKLDTPEDTAVETTEEEKAQTEIIKDKESSSPSTSEPSTEKEKEAAPEETKTASKQTPSSQEAASPPTEDLKTQENTTKSSEAAPKETEDDSKQSEETPEKAPTKEETAEQQYEKQPTAETTLDDTSTHVSESASEATLKEENKEQLSDNKYELIDYMTRFIDTEHELNDVLAGYFSRLCNILIQKKNDEMATYFYSRENLLYKLAYHSYSKSITDTVIKILDINISKLEIDENEVARIRREFVHRLLERLADDKSEVWYEYSLNIFQIFNELTFKKDYYKILIEQEILDSLKDILSKNALECTSNAAVRILNVLISHLRDFLSNSTQQNNVPSYMDDNDEVTIQDDDNENKEEAKSSEDKVANHHLVRFFKEHIINYLVEQLEVAPEKTNIDFQYGDNQFILGKKRLACINLMESLVELDDVAVRDKIMDTKFYEQLFNLFLTYRFNTFLHLHLDNIFHRILRDENTSKEHKVEFLKKLQIFEKLPSFWSDNQMFCFPSQREFRHGYLAFTTRMANTLRDISKNIPEIEELVNGGEWKHFFENDVEVYNEKNSIVLANRGGNRKDSDEFEGLEDEDDQRFKDLDEREDIDDEDDDDEDYHTGAGRTSMRETLKTYDAEKARDEHENMFVENNIEKDEEEDNLFSGLNSKVHDDDSDEDKPIGGYYDDEDSDDSENEMEDVSENSGYYDNSYWQISQYSIEDLLQQ